MKVVLALLFGIAVISCKEVKKDTSESKVVDEVVSPKEVDPLLENMTSILNAHGTLDTWKSKRVLSFEIPKQENIEKYTIDLYSRDEKIELPSVTMGSKGSDIWLLDPEKEYKGDPVFYHNLLFYFYAMPFVLADDGIQYSKTAPISFEGKSYPGIRISYEDGVGLSPKDEYFIHYNPETFQMEWLGYTVTYRTGEKSEKISWIRYNDWADIDGIVLPKSLTWYLFEDGKIKTPRSTRNFENVSLSETALPDDFFNPPKGATIVNKDK